MFIDYFCFYRTVFGSNFILCFVLVKSVVR